MAHPYRQASLGALILQMIREGVWMKVAKQKDGGLRVYATRNPYTHRPMVDHGTAGL